jgi:hypothetical protein
VSELAAALHRVEEKLDRLLPSGAGAEAAPRPPRTRRPPPEQPAAPAIEKAALAPEKAIVAPAKRAKRTAARSRRRS